MGVRRACLEIGIRNQIFLEKPEVGILIPIINQKRFFVSLDELALFMESDIK